MWKMKMWKMKMWKIKLAGLVLLLLSGSACAFELGLGMNQDAKDYRGKIEGYGSREFQTSTTKPSVSAYATKYIGKFNVGLGFMATASSASAKMGAKAKADIAKKELLIKSNTDVLNNQLLSQAIRNIASEIIDDSKKNINDIKGSHRQSGGKTSVNFRAVYRTYPIGSFSPHFGLEAQIPIGNVGPMFDDSNNVLAVVGYSSNQLLIDFKSNGDQHQINVGFRLK